MNQALSPSLKPPSLFYHVYPLGMCGAPHSASPNEAGPRLQQLLDWIPHWQALGIDALYLGPVFAAEAHGYDTIDFQQVDPRLGNHADLSRLCKLLAQAGIRTVLDGVFHHVGRGFWAFQDVLQQGQHSAYKDWFVLDFAQRSAYGDPFDYACWEGHHELVKLNLAYAPLRAYLFKAIAGWIAQYGIQGLRLDVAYALPKAFLQELAAFCRSQAPDFWLLGEVIHGEYASYLGPEVLDSVTNYECYKGLWSSHNDRNYFEIAYSLNRLFGPQGRCQGKMLYNFADNHDVNRVASSLKDPRHLYPLYILLYSMPGLPSLYYGSELGLQGERSAHSDQALRPALKWADVQPQLAHNPLLKLLLQLGALRQQLPALQSGAYQQVHVSSEQFGFLRTHPQQSCLVLVNMADQPQQLTLQTSVEPGLYQDLLNPGIAFDWHSGPQQITLDPHWGRLLLKIS